MSTRVPTAARLGMVLGVIVGIAAGLGIYRLFTYDRTAPTTGPTTGEVYDLEPYKEVDPGLVKWTETGGFEVDMKMPRSLAVAPDGSIAVVGDNTVVEYATDGTPERTTEINTPEAVAYSPDGILHVAGKDGSIYLLPQARKLDGPQLDGPVWIKGLEVTEEHIYLADAGNRVVHVLSRSGKKQATFGKPDPDRNIDGIIVRSPALDVAMAPDGLLRVANTGRLRVEGYTRRGDLEVKWGKASPDIDGFCGCCNPVNIAVFNDGRVVTAEKGLPRVKVYEPLGAFKEVVAPPASFDEDVSGLDVAIDAADRVLVLDPSRRRVRIFKRNETETEK